MLSFISALFSKVRRFSKKEKRLDSRIAKQKLHSARILFSSVVCELAADDDVNRLSGFVSSRMKKLGDPFLLADTLPRKTVRQAVALLGAHRQFTPALELCEIHALDEESLDVLAMQGNGKDIARRIADASGIRGKELVEAAVSSWEQHNDDLGDSPALVAMLCALPPENMPKNARAYEITGRMAEAAELYERDNLFAKAAHCYESAGSCAKAEAMYLRALKDQKMKRK